MTTVSFVFILQCTQCGQRILRDGKSVAMARFKATEALKQHKCVKKARLSKDKQA